MRFIISLSIVLIAFNTTKIRRIKRALELFTSEKQLYIFVCEFPHLHPSETQNRRQN